MEFLNDIAALLGASPKLVATVGAAVVAVVGYVAGKKRERKKQRRQIRL